MGRKNITAALFLIAVGIGYGILTARLPGRTDIRGVPGPAFFPWLVDIAVMVFAVILLIQGVMLARREGIGQIRLPGWRAVATLVLFVLYLAMLPYLGFIVASIPFFTALMLLYGARRLIWVAIAGPAIPVLLFYFFGKVFNIPLPQGLIHFLGS